MQAKMWGETHALVRNHGGSVVSTANAWPLRFEVPPTGSALLQMLGSFGHRPRFVGASKRLEPSAVANHQIDEVEVDIFEID
jgi:hypothetical protein